MKKINYHFWEHENKIKVKLLTILGKNKYLFIDFLIHFDAKIIDSELDFYCPSARIFLNFFCINLSLSRAIAGLRNCFCVCQTAFNYFHCETLILIQFQVFAQTYKCNERNILNIACSISFRSPPNSTFSDIILMLHVCWHKKTKNMGIPRFLKILFENYL
jgi:hypothetical protein